MFLISAHEHVLKGEIFGTGWSLLFLSRFRFGFSLSRFFLVVVLNEVSPYSIFVTVLDQQDYLILSAI